MKESELKQIADTYTFQHTFDNRGEPTANKESHDGRVLSKSFTFNKKIKRDLYNNNIMLQIRPSGLPLKILKAVPLPRRLKTITYGQRLDRNTMQEEVRLDVTEPVKMPHDAPRAVMARGRETASDAVRRAAKKLDIPIIVW